MKRHEPLEPPRRTEISVGPDTDQVVDAVRTWHCDERHEGPFEFCRERPCLDVLEALP